MKRLTTILTAALMSTGALLATSATADAAPCRSGYFCVWTDANFQGLKIEHGGDDHWWEGDMFKHDSSWANHGISGPNIPDHVKVYEGRERLGRVTLCLAPGQEIGFDSGANDQGGSHAWSVGC